MNFTLNDDSIDFTLNDGAIEFKLDAVSPPIGPIPPVGDFLKYTDSTNVLYTDATNVVYV